MREERKKKRETHHSAKERKGEEIKGGRKLPSERASERGKLRSKETQTEYARKRK